MGQPSQMQTILEGLIDAGGKVYFQPPSNINMTFPCFVYKRDSVSSEYADNRPYRSAVRYEITYINRKATSPVFDKVLELAYCKFIRSFTKDQLHHDIFHVYL